MDTLLKIYSIPAPSKAERELSRFVIQYINTEIPEAVVKSDIYGNIYVTKGIFKHYPCIIAHLDEKHPIDRIEGREVAICFDEQLNQTILCAYKTDAQGHIVRCGLGADDKNGIYIALMLLKTTPGLKLTFFIEEEIGCRGSQQADIGFYDDCYIIIECDKKGDREIVTEVDGVELCPKDIATRIQHLSDRTNSAYTLSKGGKTDVVILKRNGVRTPCINVSCGYYNPHSDMEYSIFGNIIKCFYFCKHLIANLKPQDYELL